MIVGETRCSCADGFVVVATMPDGSEHATDASGTTTSDLVAWAKRVRERTRELSDATDRLRMLVKLDAVLALTRLYARACSECDGKGWLFRLHRDEMKPFVCDASVQTAAP